ncbi:MAG: thiamine-monophosphate kinase [Actinomycetota bacterium]|jgi:thiamine-monophosphate kinase|nr:thiamine-monophosphate kinase [Actinomycetota bacterium]
MNADATARDVGEFGLIARVIDRLVQSPAVLLGPGDDAAVVTAPDGRVVASTDVLVEGVHFRREWSSGYDVGRKAAAANLADIAAMGARGTALLVGLAAPADLPVAWSLELADGLRDEAAVVGASVVGGDVVRSDTLVVSVTALGDLEGRDPVTRSGARPGDVVVLAGELGQSAAGLDLLVAGAREGALVDAHRRPTPPYEMGPMLALAGATSMCDVSDGLVADIGHIARASGVHIDLDSADEQFLTGGEDHSLVATMPAGAQLPVGVRVIGRVLAGDAVVTVAGAAAPGGWDHFA